MKKKQNSNLRLIIDLVSRDKYFFDEYAYSYKFSLPELSALRTLDHEHIDEVILRRRKLGYSFGKSYGGSWGRYQRPITDDMLINLHKLCTLLLAHDKPYKFTISCDVGHIYTNEFALCSSLHKAEWIDTLECRQISLDFPRDSIYIKKSNYAKRTYFKNQSISLECKERLANMRDNNAIRFGPGLTQWIDKFPHSKYVCDNFFIDHNDDSILTLLHLATGIQIKKTLSIVCDK